MSDVCPGKRATSTSRAARAVAATDDPDAPGMTTWYGWKSPSMACTASYTAACTVAKSRMDAGPRLPLAGAVMIWAAKAFQSTTASATADGAVARDALTTMPRRAFEILITVLSSATRRSEEHTSEL